MISNVSQREKISPFCVLFFTLKSIGLLLIESMVTWLKKVF